MSSPASDVEPDLTHASLSPTPSLSKGKKRSSNAPSLSSPIKAGKSPKPRKGRPPVKSEAGRNTGSWSKEEVRALWDAMGVIPTKISWENVAERVNGRDKLSCSNKWRYDLLPKIQAFIDSLGD